MKPLFITLVDRNQRGSIQVNIAAIAFIHQEGAGLGTKVVFIGGGSILVDHDAAAIQSLIQTVK